MAQWRHYSQLQGSHTATLKPWQTACEAKTISVMAVTAAQVHFHFRDSHCLSSFCIYYYLQASDWQDIWRICRCLRASLNMCAQHSAATGSDWYPYSKSHLVTQHPVIPFKLYSNRRKQSKTPTPPHPFAQERALQILAWATLWEKLRENDSWGPNCHWWIKCSIILGKDQELRERSIMNKVPTLF